MLLVQAATATCLQGMTSSRGSRSRAGTSRWRRRNTEPSQTRTTSSRAHSRHRRSGLAVAARCPLGIGDRLTWRCCLQTGRLDTAHTAWRRCWARSGRADRLDMPTVRTALVDSLQGRACSRTSRCWLHTSRAHRTHRQPAQGWRSSHQAHRPHTRTSRGATDTSRWRMASTPAGRWCWRRSRHFMAST
jgi:hypothetical protein